MLKNLFEERCKHRHTRKDHPHCFDLTTKNGEKLPKVLLFDIETSPMEAYVWTTMPKYISKDLIKNDYIMLSWSAKWLFSPEIMSDVLTKKEVLARSDKRISQSLWDLLNEADIVIAHNGYKFDIKKAKTRFIVNGLPPTTPFNTIDTLRSARRVFSFTSNSLDGLLETLGIESRKLQTTFKLWKDCLDGNTDALRTMEEYNKHDVVVLEELYIRMRPWIPSHPNMSLYAEGEENRCAICGSSSVKEDGTYNSSSTVYTTFRCSVCSAVTRSSKAVDKRKPGLRSL